jgi:hypothetical protein
MSPLATRNVEHTGPDWKPEHVDDPSHFTAIALQREEWLVFAEVLGVEVMRPPLDCLG